MKELLENFKSSEKQTQKTIAFFGFYFVFFIVVFSLIIFGGNKDYLHQEYEKGNSYNNKGVLNKNFLYDYKITVDGVLYDYYGKRYGDVESFKYNNQDYYRDKDQYFVHKEEWETIENPYVFYELIDFDNLAKIMSKATFIDKKEIEKGMEYQYKISSNTLNEVVYNKNTDLDEVPNTMIFKTDEKNNITNILFQFDSLCISNSKCQEHLKIEMNFEMFGGVNKIDNPMS